MISKQVLIAFAFVLVICTSAFSRASPVPTGTRNGKQYYSPNIATQMSSPVSGAGGTAISSGTSNAGRYWKRSVDTEGTQLSSDDLRQGKQYYGNPNLATQMSSPVSGAGGTAISSGTSNAGRYWKRSVDTEGTQLTSGDLRQGKQWYGGGNNGMLTSNANPAGAGGTAISSGTSNAGRYWKR